MMNKSGKKKKVVLTYGTFDLFHYGHLQLLRRAKALGDILLVGVSTDEFNVEKMKFSYQNYQHRSTVVSSMTEVDRVFAEHTWDQKSTDIIKNQVNLFVMGDDWEGKFDYLSALCEVMYLPRTRGISSTLLRDSMLKMSR